MAAGATVALGEHIRGHRFENASRTLTVEFGTHHCANVLAAPRRDTRWGFTRR